MKNIKKQIYNKKIQQQQCNKIIQQQQQQQKYKTEKFPQRAIFEPICRFLFIPYKK